ncbi:50S ribosomal protein L32 [Vagococcus vulneris]|uniref:Large ribosomal subunit protein bL32 n=1 Tax=Vagococcus vulneris TaxID=1977869 RepID=A0A430A1V6_9ENTE|nr:50S ribosomal protein L32 [Vagococcus vulneris]RSU00436.1 50S ribosomal protein L32 [Vagococcus vulneris]
MAVPARRSSKTKRLKRQSGKGLTAPKLSFSNKFNEYHRSHHMTEQEYLERKGKK